MKIPKKGIIIKLELTIFWDFGEGCKEEGKYERLCFGDMKSP